MADKKISALNELASADIAVDDKLAIVDTSAGETKYTDASSFASQQTTTNMMSKGTVYRFDGVDDVIDVSTLAAHLVNTNNTTGALLWKGSYTQITGVAQYLYGFGDTNAAERIALNITATGTIQSEVFVAGVNQWRFTTDRIIPADTEMSVLLVQNGTTPVLYINGIVEPITFSTSTDLTSWFHETTGIDNGYLGARVWSSVAIGSWFGGVCSFFDYLNFAPTASEVKDLISGNIPFKWQYGSQTLLNVSSFADSTANAPSTASTGMSATGFTFLHDGTGLGATKSADEITVELGKEYTISFDLAMTSGTPPLTRIHGNPDPLTLALSPAAIQSADGHNSYTFTPILAGVGGLNFWNDGTASSYAVTNISVTQTGAVALYDQTSISETTWYDKANGNDGAVTGAEVLNPPSVTPLLAMHMQGIRLQPGGTPNTNINCTERSSSDTTWNPLALTDGTNIAKDASSGSFALDATGKDITVSMPKEVVGLLGYGFKIQDINSSTTTEVYNLLVVVVGGDLVLRVTKRGVSSATVDWTTILDDGDLSDVWISYVTAT